MVLALILIFTVSSVWAADTVKLAVMEPLSGTFKDIGDRYLEGVQYAARGVERQGRDQRPASRGHSCGQRTEAGDRHHQGHQADPDGRCEILLRGHRKLRGRRHGSTGAETFTYFLHLRHGGRQPDRGKMQPQFLSAVRQHGHPVGSPGNLGSGPGVQKGCLYRPGLLFGKEATAGFINKLKELNPDAQIVAQILHPIGNKDFAPYVSQIINSGAEWFSPRTGEAISPCS
jgi:branched-chain amino acid transport system substrate-binding protein